jgi:hypothetical protein
MGHGKRLGMAVIGAATLTGMLTAPAWASQETSDISCGATQLTIRTNTNNSGDNGGWSVAQIVGAHGQHLIPTAFSGSLYDSTIGEVIFTFSAAKGGGHANNQQSTTECSQEFSGTLADFLEPGDTPPPGTSATDEVTFTFTATVVRKG